MVINKSTTLVVNLNCLKKDEALDEGLKSIMIATSAPVPLA